jgi:uncharacterized protein
MLMSKTEDVARALLDSMRSGDLGGALATITDDCVIRASTALPWGGERVGQEGFSGILQTMATLFATEIHSYEVFADGDVAVIRAQTTFTSRSTGQAAPMAIAEIYRVRDGRIAEMDVYYKDPQVIGALAGYMELAR